MGDAARILIVDDEPAILRVLELALDENGWKIESVGSAELALSRLRDAEFDLFLVDKNLPGMSGLDFVREVRLRDEVAGVVMMTGYASAASARDALNLGVDAYLTKPFADIYDVGRQVRETLVEVGKRRRAAKPGAAAVEPSLKIVIASPSEKLRAQVAAHLDPTRDELQHAVSSEDLLDKVGRGGVDLAILDGSGSIVERVAEVRGRAPSVACVVTADR
jgi:DNA-binding response OmpR family regulator